MIKLTNVYKRYPSGNLALDNVSLDIDKGELVFIVGSSGAGKSTLIPTMYVYDNVAFALRATKVSNKDIRQRVPYILNLVGLQGKARSMPEQISGGEQQRVALARALVNNPDLILADEPTGNIDPELSYEIVELLTEINKVGTTIVMVTHEHELVAQFDHRIIQIEKGRLVADTGKIGGHNGRK